MTGKKFLKLGLRGLFILFFAAPLVSGLVNRLADHEPFDMADYGAIACAGERLKTGQPLYVPGQARNCEDYVSPHYLYLPLIAGVEAGVQETFGQDGARLLYVGLYCIAAMYIFYFMFFRQKTPGLRKDRWMYLGLIPITPLWWTNIATLVYGVILYFSTRAWKTPGLFLCALILLSFIKVTYLAFLLMLVFLPFPLWQRIMMPVLGGMAGLLALFSFVHLQPDVAGQWLAGLNFAAIEYTAGNGVMHWSQILGLSGVEKVFFILFYMGLIVAVMLVVSEEAKASLSQRIALALACATLITPRIMPYDVFLLAPGLCVLVDLVRDRSHHLGRWAGRLTATGCSLAVLMSLAGYADQRLDIAWAFFSGVILLAGYVYWPKNWLQFFTNLKTRPQNYTFDRAGDF